MNGKIKGIVAVAIIWAFILGVAVLYWHNPVALLYFALGVGFIVAMAGIAVGLLLVFLGIGEISTNIYNHFKS